MSYFQGNPSSLQDDLPPVNIKVHRPDNTFIQFIIKMNTPLEKLMTAYCETSVSINYGKVFAIFTIKNSNSSH